FDAPEDFGRIAVERGPFGQRSSVQIPDELQTSLFSQGHLRIEDPSVGSGINRRPVISYEFDELTDGVLAVANRTFEFANPRFDGFHRLTRKPLGRHRSARLEDSEDLNQAQRVSR